MRHMNIDIETFSSVDLMKSGLYRYVQSPDFQILLFAYSLDGGPVEVIDLSVGQEIPGSVISLLYRRDCLKHAYNASFEWYCLSKHLIIPDPAAWLSQWRCTMLHGLYCGYTAGLAATGEALGLSQDKRKLGTGKSLIKTFCTPCAPTARNGHRTRTYPHHEPDKWALFVDYNRQDVYAEAEIERRLSPWPVPDAIQRQWELDQRTNALGVAVDRDMIVGALDCSSQVTAELTAEAVQLTGLDNPNSVAQLKKWLDKELPDEEIETLNKETVSGLLKKDLDNDTAVRVLEIRKELAKTSVKKYTAMEQAVCDDGRVRGLLQFYGANRTGRWAGRLVQVQNLPRTYIGALPLARQLVKERKVEQLKLIYGSLPDTLSQLIRTALVPAPGHVFLDADFSAIEARVVAWLAGEDWALDVFRGDGRIYEACAAQMFGVDVSLISKGNPEYALRQKGKVATLALGYGGGAGALVAMGALKQGLTEEELPDIVQRWRQANKRIRDLWYQLEAAAIETVRSGKPQGVRGLILALEGDAASNQWFMTITLPSGRKLFYARPFIAVGKFDNDALFYWGMDQTSKKWKVIDTWGGKLVENVVQAIARDCLSETLGRLGAAGYNVAFHVHDEVVIEAPQIAADLDAVCTIMSQPIPWAPDLPLGADGWIGEFYRKD